MARVLIADDQPELIELFEVYLTRAGHETLSAIDGEKAFELAVRHAPEIIVSDLYMPSISGLQLARKLKLRDQFSFILMTGYPDFDGKDLLEAGIGGVLVKPIDPKTLMELINSEASYFQQKHKYKKKRRFIRRSFKEKELKCMIDSPEFVGPVTVVNLGMGGFGLCFPTEFTRDHPKEFKFKLSSAKASLSGKAQVRWTQSGKKRIFAGCEFSTETKERLLKQGLIGKI